MLTFTVVVLRYLFNVGSVVLQELLVYLHSLIFLLGAAYTLKEGGHVRVDIFYRPMPMRKKAWVNLLGTLFLLMPCCLFIFTISWEYVASSWSYFEGSREAGGIDAVFALKSLLLLMPATVMLQGIAQAMQSLLIITGQIPSDESNQATPH